MLSCLYSTVKKLVQKIMPRNTEHHQPHKDYPRVLFVLKYRENYGSPYCANDSGNWGDDAMKQPLSSGLFNSARMVVEMLEQSGVPVKLVHVWDNSTIHRELVAFKADIVVIEAFWVVPEKFDELYRVCPNVTFVIRNHSETPFLAQEGIAFDWMLKYIDKPNVIMSANSMRMNEETFELARIANPQLPECAIEKKIEYLPNYYQLLDLDPEHHHYHKDTIDIGCFGAIRPLKNQLMQAIAAIKFANVIGKRLRFHINGKRVEMNGDQVLKNMTLLFSHYPDFELVMHDWMSHDEFRKLVASMDIVMQVSFSETFNIVAADAVSQGVLTVTSPEVRWSAREVQADPTSFDDIVRTLLVTWKHKTKCPDWNPNLDGLLEYNRASRKVWLSFLGDYKKPQ